MASEPVRILLFGDSIVAGYGLKTAASVPVQLESALRAAGHEVTVIDGGVSGDTTSGGRTRLRWMVNKHAPDLVVLALGGNDVLRGIPPEVTRQNIDAMLHFLQARDIRVILSAAQATRSLGETYMKKFNVIYPELAQQYDVPLYPFLISDTFGDRALMQPDGIHPNARGAARIAENLAEYLAPKLSSAAPASAEEKGGS